MENTSFCPIIKLSIFGQSNTWLHNRLGIPDAMKVSISSHFPAYFQLIGVKLLRNNVFEQYVIKFRSKFLIIFKIKRFCSLFTPSPNPVTHYHCRGYVYIKCEGN